VSAERFRTRAGSLLHVEDSGGSANRGLPIVALHGLGGGAWFFSGLARRLAPDRRVIAVDLPGTGRSTSGVPLSIDSWLADLDDLLTARGATPAILLGHSMGTIVALEAWAAWPHHIRALIFVGGLPEPQPLIRERLTLRAASVERDGLAGVGPQAAIANFAKATLARQPELVALFERVFEAQDPGVYVRWCRLLVASSAASVVPSVTVPCCAITGAEDQYAPPGLVSAFMRELPGAVREEALEDCAHLPFLESPDAFAAAVTSFAATLC
jgi:pimeloyl-ACP methyl ester carboxylesterase